MQMAKLYSLAPRMGDQAVHNLEFISQNRHKVYALVYRIHYKCAYDVKLSRIWILPVIGTHIVLSIKPCYHFFLLK